MAITNLNNQHLAATELAAALQALTQLENSLASINVNLTAADRQKYGSINEQNKLFVNKVHDFHKGQANLQTSQVDWEEFDKDFSSRNALENIILRMNIVATKLQSAKILHDYDNYQAALVDYAYTSFMAGTGAEGFETKNNELKQFFAKTSKTTNSTP